MTEPVDPSGTTVTSGDQDPPLRVPPFVCVLPCTKPAVKYGDGLDGCASGIHPTPEDMKDLHVLYSRMADVILAKDTPPEEASADKCPVCMVPIVPSQASPVMYMEKCFHNFHYHCYEEWRHGRWQFDGVTCPHCRTLSSRTILWYQLFSKPTAKNQLFQLQKRCFGLDVAPETSLSVYCLKGFPDVYLHINRKSIVLRKQPVNPLPPRPQPPAPAPAPGQAPGQAPGPAPAPEPAAVQPPAQAPPPLQAQVAPPANANAAAPVEPELEELFIRAKCEVTEPDLVRAIQVLHLADQPRRFYLGDILPLEENQALFGPVPPMSEVIRREKMLLQFWCPFRRLEDPRPGHYCSEGEECEFFHAWPQKTPAFIKERVIVRQFPNFFCLGHTRFFSYRLRCSELIRGHPQELARCANFFHPTSQDLKDIDGFGFKMANLIMSPVVVPEPSQSLVCSLCRKSAQPNSIWIHMQNCAHCLHVDCLPLVRHNYRHLNRKLDVHCPACQVPSVRVIAWPGQFRTDMLKKAIFKRQLSEFKLYLEPDTQVAIVQVTNIFTVDYGGPRVVTIDCSKFMAYPNSNDIWVD